MSTQLLILYYSITSRGSVYHILQFTGEPKTLKPRSQLTVARDAVRKSGNYISFVANR